MHCFFLAGALSLADGNHDSSVSDIGRFVFIDVEGVIDADCINCFYLFTVVTSCGTSPVQESDESGNFCTECLCCVF